jgi:23S rRNA (guanosine2251-2'-O)-methyltransferase
MVEIQRLISHKNYLMNIENLIIGRQPVLEALKAHQLIEKIIILQGTSGSQISRIKQLAKTLNIPIQELENRQFSEITPDANSQGIIAFIDSYHYVDIEDIISIAQKRSESPFILILDEIEDPHNLGALIRTAECAGVHGIIIPMHHTASVNATVTKTSAGATAHIAIARVTNIVQIMNELKKKGIWIVGTEISGDKSYIDQDYSGPLAIVIGNEGRGIRRLVKEKCDFLVRIPMRGKIESLNASVAGALVIFEALKDRNKSS